MTNLNLRPKHSQTLTFNRPQTYYEIRDETGQRYCHCGTMKDVINIINLYPSFTYHLMYLDPPPHVVDVNHQSVPELLLQQSDLQELFS